MGNLTASNRVRVDLRTIVDKVVRDAQPLDSPWPLVATALRNLTAGERQPCRNVSNEVIANDHVLRVAVPALTFLVHRLEPEGRTVATVTAPIAIEDVAFDEQGVCDLELERRFDDPPRTRVRARGCGPRQCAIVSHRHGCASRITARTGCCIGCRRAPPYAHAVRTRLIHP